MKTIDQLEPILKNLYLISGLNMCIFDTDYQLVTSFPYQKSSFCALIDQNCDALKYCTQYDHRAFQIAKETGKLYIYQCHFHLYEAVVPLYHFGILSGYLMMGQTLTTSYFDRRNIEKEAMMFVDNQIQLKEAIQKITVHTKEQIEAFSQIVNICAEYITLTHLMSNNKKDLAEEIKTYIKQYYNTDITIEKLCQYFYCSKATLINTFKNKYHMTIHQYIMDMRLNKAQELLFNSTMSIHAIALQCGYKDANYFTKAFRKKYQISPSDYRLKNKII